MRSNRERGSVHQPVVVMAILILFSCGFVPVCASEIPVPSAPAQSQVLRIAVQDDAYGLNPFAVNDIWSRNIIDNVYDRLLNKDWKTQKVQPWIAVGWRVDPQQPNNCDKCNVTVEYKIGDWESKWGGPVYFHDGSKATIDDVLFSYGLMVYNPIGTSKLKPAMENGTTTSLAPSENGYSSSIEPLIWVRAWSDPPYGDLGFMKVTVSGKEAWLGVKKADEHSLQFRLSKQYADFFGDALDAVLFPRHVWEKHINIQNGSGDFMTWDMGYDEQNGTASGLIGSGPFVFDKWIKGQYASEKRFDKYFDWTKLPRIDENGKRLDPKQPAYDPIWTKNHPLPYIDEISFRIYKTIEAATLAISAEPPEIDLIASSIPSKMVSDLQKNPNIQLYYTSEPGFIYFAFNLRKITFGYKDFQNGNYTDVGKPFRKAIAYSTDKAVIDDNPFFPTCQKALGPINPDNRIWHNDSLPAYGVNEALAKKYLDDAGWKDTDGDGWREFPEIGDSQMDVIVPEAWTDPIRAMAAQGIAIQANKAGINLKSPFIGGNEIERIKRHDFQMYIWGWKIENSDPGYLYDLFHRSQDNALNYPGYHNTTVDRLLDEFRSTFDRSKRIQFIKDIQGNLVDNLPYNTLCYRTNKEATRKDRFVGWVQEGTGIYNPWSLLLIDSPKDPMHVDFVNNRNKIVEGESMDITAQVTNKSGVPLSDANMTLKTESGTDFVRFKARDGYPATIGSNGSGISGKIDAMGYFRVVFVAGNVTSDTQVSLTASASKPGFEQVNTAILNVIIYNKIVNRPLLMFTISPDTIYAEESAQLSVSLVDLYGRPLSGSEVTFNATIGIVNPFLTRTDTSGQAIAIYYLVENVHIPSDGLKVNITATASLAMIGIAGNETLTRSITILPHAPDREKDLFAQKTVLIVATLVAIVVVALFFFIIIPNRMMKRITSSRPSKRKALMPKKKAR